MKYGFCLILVAVMVVACGRTEKRPVEVKKQTKPTSIDGAEEMAAFIQTWASPLSAKAQQIVDSVRKDSSRFQVSLQLGRSSKVGIVLATKPYDDLAVPYRRIGHDEAVDIVEYFAENGLLDILHIPDPGETRPGWYLSLGALECYLGDHELILFKRKSVLGVRSVLSTESKKVWDAFLADAKKKLAHDGNVFAMSEKAKKAVADVRSDSSQFLFAASYGNITLEMDTKPSRDSNVFHAEIDHEEAVRIVQYFADNGLLDHTSPVYAGKAPPGWSIYAGPSYWYLGKDRYLLFKRKDFLGVSSVLSPDSQKVWDAFLVEARVKVGMVGLSEKAKKAVVAVQKDSSKFQFGLGYQYPGPNVGIVLATNLSDGGGRHHAKIEDDEAVRIILYLAEIGLLGRTSVPPEGITCGWWVHAGMPPQFHWHLGNDKLDLFKREEFLGLRSVLSPNSAKAWDKFLVVAQRKMKAIPEATP